MRPIKFRVWDLDNKEWLTDVCVYEDGSFQGTDSNLQDLDSTFNSLKLMQFTGLQDKDGEDIWEGDIVALQWDANRDNDTIHEVWWRGHGWAIPSRFSSLEETEKLGNVYENPELIGVEE